MAETPLQHRGNYVWLWIVLGIVVAIALIWWASAAGTSTQSMTTGVGTATTVQPGTANNGAAGTADNGTANQPNAAANIRS